MTMTRQQVLDQYFMDARHKLIDLAAFLDRVERAEGDADFRLDAFREALKKLCEDGTEHALECVYIRWKRLLMKMATDMVVYRNA